MRKLINSKADSNGILGKVLQRIRSLLNIFDEQERFLGKNSNKHS